MPGVAMLVHFLTWKKVRSGWLISGNPSGPSSVKRREYAPEPEEKEYPNVKSQSGPNYHIGPSLSVKFTN